MDHATEVDISNGKEQQWQSPADRVSKSLEERLQCAVLRGSVQYVVVS
jgi:hypothetical protein